MAELPSATTRIDETAGPVAVGTKLTAIFAPVPTNADLVPRLFSNAASIYANHGYSTAADYAALHIAETGLPVLFVPVAIETAGEIGRIDQTGNTNTSVVSCAPGGSGSLDECDGVVTVVTGGVVGTANIVFDYSLDGGLTTKRVKLGAGTSYTIPYVGHVLSFGVGSLTAGEVVLTYHSTGPKATQYTEAITALSMQNKQVRNLMIIGDMVDAADANAVLDAVDLYETGSERYIYAKAQLRDRLPGASLSQTISRMSGTPTVTFAEVGESGDTITRSAGSFVTDGFAVGDTIRVSGSVSNNVTCVVAGVSALVLTLGSQDLVGEGPVSGVAITAEPTITFAEVGGTADTISRNRGSFFADGFRTGDMIAVTGSDSNDFEASAASTIIVTSATVLTLDSQALSAEVIGSIGLTISAGETKAQHVAALDAEMGAVVGKRLDLGFGRGRKTSHFLGAQLRRPVQWADNIRAFQHDLHVATFKKNLGVIKGFSLTDSAGTLVEHDERFDGGALAARFTCFRTWGNGPDGTFIALSMTRAGDASILSRTQNMAVADVAQSVAQAEAENAIGESLILNSDGTATSEALAVIKQRVDSALKRNLLANLQGEGQRASDAYWTPDASAVLNTPGATLPAVLTLVIRGTIEHIATIVRVS